MDDLASLVLEKMSVGDGPSEMSVLQSSRREKCVIVTPFVSEGKTTFNVYFTEEYNLGNARSYSGFNSPNAEAVAAILVEHAKIAYAGHEKTHIRFVHTESPTDGAEHLSVPISDGKNEALCNILNAVAFMRPLK